MHRVIRHGGPPTTTSSAKIWRPVSTKRCSQRASAGLPWISPAHELSPGNRKRMSSASIRSSGRGSPAFSRERLRSSSRLASHESIRRLLVYHVFPGGKSCEPVDVLGEHALADQPLMLVPRTSAHHRAAAAAGGFKPRRAKADYVKGRTIK